MSLTKQAKLQSARRALPQALIEEDGDRVTFRCGYTAPGGAWRLERQIRLRLESVGLTIVQVQSDRKSVWGYIEMVLGHAGRRVAVSLPASTGEHFYSGMFDGAIGAHCDVVMAGATSSIVNRLLGRPAGVALGCATLEAAEVSHDGTGATLLFLLDESPALAQLWGDVQFGAHALIPNWDASGVLSLRVASKP